ncbi:MAG: hypothetical protein K2Z25_08645 [Beijerinckiaceae bacterium]|nr:hypothetical protein [Beijerinckiaceae bacterium]
MAIIYPNGVSCVCYIGRQGVRIQGSRVYAHAKGWIGRHLTLMQSDEVFMIHYSPARQAGVSDAYKDIESYLIRDFQEKFGAPPLFNFSKGKEIYQFPIEDASTLFRRRRLKGVVDGQRGIDIDVKIASGQEP